jgi:hypothetical protein
MDGEEEGTAMPIVLPPSSDWWLLTAFLNEVDVALHQGTETAEERLATIAKLVTVVRAHKGMGTLR